MPGLEPGIHVLFPLVACSKKTWMAGTNPAMTITFPESGWIATFSKPRFRSKT
jgi:hypothetical protein